MAAGMSWRVTWLLGFGSTAEKLIHIMCRMRIGPPSKCMFIADL